MSDTTRDTQFQGYAKLLLDELKPNLTLLFVELGRRNEEGIVSAESIIQSVIAQRAYDLVQHTVGYSLEYLEECGIPLSGSMGKRIQPSIPDLTTLPNQDEGGTAS